MMQYAAALGLAMLVLAGCLPEGAVDRAGQARIGGAGPTGPFEEQRHRMVEEQIAARGIKDPRVLQAMREVPRHQFVPAEQRGSAYEDRPLPIGQGQTISQPYIVAYMSEALEVSPGQKVLEIGTGSGYQAAVLAAMGADVYTIEIVPELAARAEQTLAELGYGTVHVRTGNGYLGWPEEAPFDRVIVTAAPDEMPQALVDQLGDGGRLVAPVGTALQEMVILTKRAGEVTERRTIPVMFVPMTGKPGR